MKKIYLLLLATLLFFGFKKKDKVPAYKNAKLDIEARVSDLLSRMTLEEKVKQLDMYSGADLVVDGRLSVEKAKKAMNGMSIGSVHDYYPETAEYANELQKFIIENNRLRIPALFIEEALHGYCGAKATAFPMPIGMGSMWDVELMEKIGQAVAAETRSVNVHMVLGPVLGIGREPRWGRVEETYSEDPYLAARNGVAIINGMQGDDLTKDNTIAAEPKHYGIHSIPEGGNNSAPPSISERDARTNFLYVFEKAFAEAGALGAMAAYHEWDGVPAIADPFMLKTLLRDEWGFKGMVISDLGAIRRQINPHCTAANAKEAIVNSVSAGLDMQFYDFSHEEFQQSLIEAINDKSLSMEDLDRAVSSVLYVKFRMGLFENPYIDNSLKAERYHCKAHQDLALESAQKSIVLLQNNDNILPLSDKVKNIAVIGEMANELTLGDYSPKEVEGLSIIEAFKGTDFNIDFVDTKIPVNNAEEIDAHLLQTETGETGLFAEYFNNSELSGNPTVTRVELGLSKYWHNLSPVGGVNPDHFSVRWTGYLIPEVNGIYEFSMRADDLGKFTIDGEVLLDTWVKDISKRKSRHKIRLEKGKKYSIKLEYAEITGLAGVSLSWNITSNEKRKTNKFDKAIAAAQKADVAILVLGEKLEECGEGKDRLSLELNGFSKKLINEVSATGTPVILVLQNGRPLILSEEYLQVAAILETWYAGESSGQATIDVITGKINPSGKLPITFPSNIGQLPAYYNKKKSSVGSYIDGDNKPLFAFGHGLSYSKFEYSDLTIVKPEIGTNEEQTVTLKVKNVSDREGTEIVQLYINDVLGSVVTQKMQLRGFKRIDLKPGEEKEVTFTLIPDDLALWNREMKRVVEPGKFIVKVGAASDDLRLEDSFQVK